MSNLARSAVWVTISEIVFNLSGYIIHSAVGRILGPSDYGRYGLVVTLTTMVIILIGNGIPTAMAKYISEIFETKPNMVKVIKRQAIIIQTIIIGVVTLLFFISAPLIARLLNDPSLTGLFRISTLIIPTFALASFYFSYFTGLHRFNLQSILKTLRSVVKIIAIVGLAYLYKVEGSIIGYIIAPASIFLIAWLIDKLKVSKELKEVQSGQKDIEVAFDYRKLINYAWQIVVFFLAYELFISIDLYLVKGIMRDDYLTGIYNASLTVGRIPYYIFYALTVILLPVISKTTAEDNQKETGKIISQSLRLMLILLVPGVILMSNFSQSIIRLFYSAKYDLAALPMSILVYGVGFLTIFYVMSFVMNGAGKTKIPMWISIIGVIINAGLNYVLIKKYGLLGSAVATTITSFLAMLAMLYYIHRDFQVVVKLKNLSKIIIAGLIMYVLALFFPKGVALFPIWSIILFFFYLIILYIFGEIEKADLDYVKKVIKWRNSKKLEEKII